MCFKRLGEEALAILTTATAATADRPLSMDNVRTTFLVALRRSMMNEPMGFVNEVCHLAGGHGGPGGSRRTAQDKSGAQGKDQSSNKAHAQLVSLSSTGKKTDCLIDQAIDSPEQCQMLLDKADWLYFTGDIFQYPQAVQHYTKLTKRLGFLDLMVKDKAKENNLRTSSPLANALQNLDSSYALTTDTLAQLDRIYSTAQRRLNGIRLNQDLWGHSDVWVPRLSPAYYGNRVDTMIERFKDVEATFKEYAHAEQKQQITENQLEQVQIANGAMERAATA
ncbi:hypothetical protein Sste5346_009144 [Sporothrix stenoceras]|uniref:Uncharacterized protein n=1 Tax=Sporothrix stenoceras TaxID=5173 RepID=A0ABR3YLS6_9PEZI